jgi:hypothetical protein
MMTPLIKQLEDNPNISVIKFSSQVRSNHRAMTLVVVPSLTAEQGATETLRRQARWWEGLVKICHFSRAPRMLLPEELDALQAACTAYCAAYREAYPNHPILTQKGHLIEMHLASIARRFGTVGIFGHR